MSERSKGAYEKSVISSPVSPGVRVSRKAWEEHRHLPDEELVARGIPARMVRRMRRKAQV